MRFWASLIAVALGAGQVGAQAAPPAPRSPSPPPAPPVPSAVTPPLVPVEQKPPVPGQTFVVDDWVAACNNRLGCSGSSLMRESEQSDVDMIAAFTISPPPGAAVRMELLAPEQSGPGPFRLEAKGALVHEFADGPSLTKDFALDAKGLRAMLAADALLLTDAAGKTIGQASLKGFRDALLRAQTTQRSGKADLRQISTLSISKVPRAAPMEPTPREVIGLRKRAGCELEKGEWQDRIIAPLDRITSLILLSCGAGAYNYSYVPFLGRIENGQRRFSTPIFDLSPEWGEQGGPPMLVNPSWDGNNATLSLFAKGRGLGDCGTEQAWVWTGGRFMLSAMKTMPECRGSTLWLSIFEADVAITP